MMNTEFNVPSMVLAGGGCRKELTVLVKRLQASRVLLVTDAFMMSHGCAQELIDLLTAEGLVVSVFSDVQPDPTVDNVYAGLELFQESDSEVIVALGGGSPMDAAKAISVLTRNPKPLSTYMGYHRVPQEGVPLIAIPTTAGTGSEATKVSVITDTERNVKMMMLDRAFMPDAAIIDYELTLSMPQSLTAHVGVDTLTHGIEAYVSRKANGLTDPIALSCISLVARHLETAWSEPDNVDARAGMALAACQGGMAFANSSVCLVHGMSRPLGAVFHLPHGLSNAVLLPTVTRFSILGATERYATVARTMKYASEEESDEKACHALVEGLSVLNETLKVPKLKECHGVDDAAFQSSLKKMAQDALASGSPQNNPVVPSEDDIVAIYEEAY